MRTWIVYKSMTYAIITIAPETCVIYLASTKTLLNLLHITRLRRHSGGGRVISDKWKIQRTLGSG